MESTSFYARGSPSTKLMLKSSQLSLRTGKVVYNPVFWTCPLGTWQSGQLLTMIVTSFNNCGEYYHSSRLVIVLPLPKCPASAPSCKSPITLSTKSLAYITGFSWEEIYLGYENLVQVVVHFSQILAKSLSSFYSSFKHSNPMISLCSETNSETFRLNASEILLSTPELWGITTQSRMPPLHASCLCVFCS